MKKATIVSAIALVIAIVAWLWMSPYFAVANLRNAAIKSDTAALNEHVDFPLLRADIKEQFSAMFAERMSESLKGNPFAALGMAFATKLTEVMVDTMVTPSGLAALIDLHKDKSTQEVSGFALIFAEDLSIERQGLDRFELRTAKESDKPTLNFSRDGLGWKLVGMKIPKDFMADKMQQSNQPGRAPTPYAPEWRSGEYKDPMDDKVTNTLIRGADEEIRISYGTVRPNLVFRCSNSKIEGYVDVDTSVEYDYSTNRTQIRLRFDEGQAVTERWGVSRDREAVFAPNATKLLDQLAAAERMRIEVKFIGGSTGVATFTSGDLKEKSGAFLAKCNLEK